MAIRPAMASEAKPLIGLYSASGDGKTYSALLLACGFAGGDMKKVVMVETEAGRGEAFVNDPVVGGYMVRPIRGEFSPAEYGRAISEVEESKARVLIIDSASHEWEGVGGVLDMAAKNQEAKMTGVRVWQKPKMDHQRDFMLRLLQTPVPLVIVCMRAKYLMREVKKGTAKEWVRDENLSPKQDDDILFEMMVHGWMDKEHKFHVTKYTTREFRAIFIDGEPITVETGKRLAVWASGGTATPAAPAPTPPADASSAPVAGENPRKAIAAQMKALWERHGIADKEQEYLLGEKYPEEHGIPTDRVKWTVAQLQAVLDAERLRLEGDLSDLPPESTDGQ